MAESKRQNAGGKAPIATPNMGPSTMVSLESALGGVIGARYVAFPKFLNEQPGDFRNNYWKP